MLHFNAKLNRSIFLSIIILCSAAFFVACASQNAANVKTAGEIKKITDILASEGDQSAVVTVKGSQSLTYTAIRQVFPLGVLFHFPDTELDNIKKVHYPPENDIINSIRVSQIEEEDGTTTRIFVALKKERPYDITTDDSGIHIAFSKAEIPSAENKIEDTPQEKVEERSPQVAVEKMAAPATQITSITATPLKKNVVINVKADGKVQDFKTFTLNNPPRIVVDMYNLKSPYQGQRRIAVNSDWVSRVRHFGYADKIRMVFETNEEYLSKYFASPVDNGLLVYVGKIPADMGHKEVGATVVKAPVAAESELKQTSDDDTGQTAAVEPKSADSDKPDVVQAQTAAETEQEPASSDVMVQTTTAETKPDYIEKTVIAQAQTAAETEQKPLSDEPSVQSTSAPEINELMVNAAIVAETTSQPEQPTNAEKKAPEDKEEVKILTSGKPAWLNRIEFSSEEEGKSAVIIGTTRPIEYRLSKVSDTRLQLMLLKTNLPEYRKRALITTRFQSAVDRITPTQQPSDNDTLIAIEMRESVPYFVKQKNNIITVNFSPSTIPPKPYEDAKLPAWKEVLEKPSTSSGKTAPLLADKTKVVKTAEKEPMIAEKEMSLADRLKGASPARKYTGEKISLDFYDTDIKNVFRIIREISGKNFAIDKNVTGKVTLSLEKPVPWDQVLDLVLKMNQLGLTMEGDIIRIATLGTLAKEEKLRQAKLKAAQQAINQKKALEPMVTEYIPVNYSDATSEILPHVKPVLTATRGKISVDKRNNQLIITDTVDKIKQARQIVLVIDKVTPQVIIEARVVEANTTFTRDLGFDWGTVTAGPFEIGETELTLTGTASNLPQDTTTGQIAATFQKLTGTPFSIVDAKLAASEIEGKTNIISSPKIVTLDNKKAKIKQGLEVPYLERDSSGNATVRFKDVDLLLEVTPNITPDQRIVMKIFLSKNDLQDPTAPEPTVSTNEAETETIIENGDTIVIGGIVKSTLLYNEKGIPGLRKIGVLGWLFKNQRKQDTKNELLIFITPRIVQLEQRTNL